MKLNTKAFALTCGIFWALSVFVITWWVIVFYGSTRAPTFLAWFYFGYNISPLGSVIGLVWGFFDGLISGAVFC